jgi:hypothetical protein
MKQANDRGQRTQTTFATQPTLLKRSGAARLLGGMPSRVIREDETAIS